MSMLTGRPPWSLLRAQWLDVPIGEDVGPSLTWGAFSELFAGCLEDLFLHVGRRLEDRSSLAEVVTTVLVENLDVLVSPLEERERLVVLFTAADRLMAQRASADPGDTVGREGGDRFAKASDPAGDT